VYRAGNRTADIVERRVQNRAVHPSTPVELRFTLPPFDQATISPFSNDWPKAPNGANQRASIRPEHSLTKGLMAIGLTLVADEQTTHPAQPSQGALDCPTVAAQPFRALDIGAGGAGPDAPSASSPPVIGRGVGLSACSFAGRWRHRPARGRIIGMRSSIVGRVVKPLTLEAVTALANDTPCPSVRTRWLLLFLLRSVEFRLVFLPPFSPAQEPCRARCGLGQGAPARPARRARVVATTRPLGTNRAASASKSCVLGAAHHARPRWQV
jgi:hypothetical protein